MRRIDSQDQEWFWDESQAVESTPQSIEQDAKNALMLAAGADDYEQALQILHGRPTLARQAASEPTKSVQFKVPAPMIRFIDDQAKSQGVNRSEYLRSLLTQAMRSAGSSTPAHRMAHA